MLPFDENADGKSQKPLRPDFDVVMSVQNVSVKIGRNPKLDRDRIRTSRSDIKVYKKNRTQ